MINTKIKINQQELGMTMYEFEKELVDNNKSKIFKYNDDGKVTGIDYYEYAIAATNLLAKIERHSE